VKPLKLTMTAFGPYKEKEVIDFTELKDHHLFVISGNTGAGKTTIFDGICFALYGSASGSDRDDNQMLRSDFAKDETHTSAELIFSLHGKTYRIFRQPGHVKKGNKTKTGEKYEFFEIRDNREISCVDRQIVSDINKKVEEIIGLTQDQFKQIVMLPQGEFRKLLTSKTENKEAILRRLFKTENYKHLNELLKQRRDEVQQLFQEKSQEVRLYIDRIPEALPLREESELKKVLEAEHFQSAQVASALEEESQFYEKQMEENEQRYAKAVEEHDKQSTAFHEAKNRNTLFDELDQKKDELRTRNERLPEMKQKEKQLEEADRALGIEFYEKQAEQWRKEEKHLAMDLKHANEQAAIALEKVEKAEQHYQQEEGKKEERDQVTRTLDRLTDHLPAVKELDQMKQKIAKFKQQVEQAEAERKKVQTELLSKQKAHEQEKERIEKVEQALETQVEKNKQLHMMREQAKLMKNYIALKQQQLKLDEERKKREVAFIKVKTAYDEKERTWLSNQAAVLAGHLHDGDACPVCGSVEHPKKASHAESRLTREELEAAKQQLEAKQIAYQQTKAEAEANRKEIGEKEKELKENQIETGDIERQYEQLVKEGTRLSQEVDELEKMRNQLQDRKKAFEFSSKTIKDLEMKKETAENLYHEQLTAFKTSQAVYEEKIRNIPEHLQNLQALEKQIEETKQKKLNMEKAWETARQALQQEKANDARAKANADNSKKQFQQAQEKREQTEKQFDEVLKNKGFASEEAYHQAKMTEEQRTASKKELEAFYQAVKALEKRISELKETLKDKQKADLQALEKLLTECKQKYEEELHKLNRSKERKKAALELQTKITNASKEVHEYENRLARVTDLYDIMRGQNSQKISFERYLQIEYLEQIIQAANERLIKLSNGQFRLERSDRQEAHGRQSGLGLDIYDAYTGQTRDVKSLSGGEKFNASLSLALGMSDVIQSFQGNISIDTMFIDEGFGSLDEESLTKAIDTLIELQQSGRMIGVISHVQELKNMLPARLEVVKQKEGHSKTKFVVS